MPFIPMQERVRLADPKERPNKPGELCYLVYKNLVEAWNKNPSWTLFHNMLGSTFGWNDLQTAKVAALLMFVLYHVKNYEDAKKLENGDIA